MNAYFGKLLIVLGIVIIIFGVIMLFSDKIKWIGYLPGDIFIKGKNFSFYFPIVTSILLSIILTIILNLLFRR